MCIRDRIKDAELVEFEQTVPGAFGGGDKLLQVKKESFAALRSEFAFAQLVGLIESNRLQQAVVVADEFPEGILRELAQVGVMQLHVDAIDFPSWPRFKNLICKSAAQSARIRWLQNKGTTLELVDALMNAKDAQTNNKLADVVVQQNSENPGLTDWKNELKKGISNQLLAAIQVSEADEQVAIDQMDAIYENVIATETSNNINFMLRDYDDDANPYLYGIFEALLILGQIDDMSSVKDTLPNIKRVARWLGFIYRRNLADGEWQRAEKSHLDFAKLEWEFNLQRTQSETKQPWDPNSEFATRYNVAFYRSVVAAAAKRKQYLVANEYLNKIKDESERELAMFQLGAWQSEHGQVELATRNLQPFLDKFQAELKSKPEAEKLEFVIERMLSFGWRLDHDMKKLPLANVFEAEILKLDIPAEMISSLKSYQNSFTRPSPAALAFIESVLSKIDQSVEPEREVVEDSQYALAVLAEHLDSEMPKDLEQADLIDLAKRLPPGDESEYVLLQLIEKFAVVGDEDGIDLILPMVNEERKVMARVSVAELFPPTTKPFSPEFREYWQRTRSGGVF